MAVHKGQSYPGEHKPIIDQSLWDKVQAIFSEHSRSRGNRTRASTPAPLKGIIRCKSCDCAMTPSHTRKKNGRLYRYYVCMSAIKNGHDTCEVKSIAAGEAEEAVINQVRTLIRSPEVIARTWKQVKKREPDIRESEIIDALLKLDPVWNELFPGEQARILALLVENVEVSLDGLAIKLRTEGLDRLVEELGDQPREPEGVA